MEIDKVTAPWTADQVERLNAWQASPHTHEYTCLHSEHGALVATPDGWQCTTCNYEQDWAHAFSAAWGGDL